MHFAALSALVQIPLFDDGCAADLLTRVPRHLVYDVLRLYVTIRTVCNTRLKSTRRRVVFLGRASCDTLCENVPRVWTQPCPRLVPAPGTTYLQVRHVGFRTERVDAGHVELYWQQTYVPALVLRNHAARVMIVDAYPIRIIARTVYQSVTTLALHAGHQAFTRRTSRPVSQRFSAVIASHGNPPDSCGCLGRIERAKLKIDGHCRFPCFAVLRL